MISGAGRLAAKYVIHAVGPVWHGGTLGQRKHCWPARFGVRWNWPPSMAATASRCRPSAGAYGYPLPHAARVAIGTALEFLRTHFGTASAGWFVLFDQRALSAFQEALHET